MTRTGAPSARPATEESRPVRRGLRRALAALATFALGAGLAVVGAAAPASAHTGDLKATAVCNADTGEYEVTYTLKLSSVPAGNTGTTKWRVGGSSFQGTPTSAAGMDLGPVTSTGNTTITLGTESLPGDTVGNGPWVYAYTKWSPDGFGKGSDGRVENLKGDCGEDGPSVKKITFCHATSSATNPYNRITTSVNAFLNSGHISHDGDIYPAFTYVKKGQTIEVPAKGDQELLKYPDCAKPEPTEVPVPAKPGIVDLCGVANDHIVRPADTEALTWTVTPVVGGTATAKVVTKPGYAFADGTTERTFEFAFTNEPCVVEIPVPAKPEIVDQCGVDGDAVVTPAAAEGVEWSISPVSDSKATATATAKAGYVFAGGKTEVVFEFAFTDEPCPPQSIALTALPTPVEQCGVADDDVKLPSQEHVSWSVVSKVDGRIVVRATAADGFVLAADGEFEGGTTRDFAFDFSTEPCPEVIEVPVQPASIDLCGVDRDRIVQPEPVTGVRWEIGEIVDGKATAVAHAEDGFVFVGGLTEVPFEFSFDQTECETPTLFGSTAAAVCEANTPWIVFDVVLNDPDGISTGHTAYLVLSDGTHTEKVELGALGEDGTVQGRVLWPGAAIDEAGNPIAWPGWKQLPNGRWVVTDENFGWTHSLTSATLEVNPELSIALEYPPAVVGCGPTSSPASSGDPTPIASGEGSGLASTGFAGGPLLYVAGGLVLLGGVVLAVTMIVRRKRAGDAS
jgi:hypothetical protein